MSELLKRLTELEDQLSGANARIAELELGLKNTTIQNEQRYYSLVEDHTELICRYNPDFILTYVNHAYCAPFALSPDEMIGTSFLSQIPEKDQVELLKLIQNLSKDNPVCISEYCSTLSDGSVRWMQRTDRAIFDSSGNILEYQEVARDITERKNFQAEQERNTTAIEEMRQFLQSTLDVLTSHIAVLAPDGTILKVNAAWEQFALENGASTLLTDVGVNYLTVCDSSFGELSHESAPMAAGIRAVIKGEEDSFYLEYPCNVENKQFWFGTQVTPFKEPVPRRVVVAHTDISERKHALEALESSEGKYRSLIESADSLIAMVNINGEILFANQITAIYLQLTPDSVLGKRVTDLFPPEINLIIIPAFQEVISSGVGTIVETSTVINGETQWYRSSIQPVFDIAGKAYAALINSSDITSTKKTELALRIKDNAIASTITAIAIADMQGNLTYVNAAFLDLWKYSSEEEVLGRSVLSFWETPESAAEVVVAIQESRSYRGILVARLNNGKLADVDTTASTVRDEFGKPICLMGSFNDVTERRRALEALEASEEKYRSLVESSDSAITMYNSNGDILFANKITAARLQVPVDQLLGKNLLELYEPEDSLPRLKLVQQVIATGKGLVEELPFRNTFWFRLSFQPVFDSSGFAYAVLINANDITSIKQAEEALRQSEARQRAMLQAIPDLIFRTAADGTFIDYHAPSTDLLVAPPELFLGKKSGDILPPELARRFQEANEQVIRTQGLVQFEYSLEIGGELHEFEARLAPVNSNEVVTILRNVTERKHALEALRASEEKYRSLIESSDSVITMVGKEGEVLFANKKSAQRFNETPDTLVGQSMRSFMTEEERLERRKYIQEVIKTGKGIVTEIPLAIGGETYWYRSSIQPVLDTSGVPFAAMINSTDITSAKQAEERIKTLSKIHAALSQSNQAIVRIRNRQELFEELCRVAVVHGGLTMSWIGFVVPETKKVEVIASHGISQEYLDLIDISIDPSVLEGHGPTGTAIREKRPFICNDFLSNPLTVPWRTAAEAYGFKSSAAFPLYLAGEPIGALTLYSTTLNYFNPEVTKLLIEMADDISYAMDNMALEETNARTQAELHLSEERFRAVVEQSSAGISIIGYDNRFETVNQRFCQILGYDSTELLSKSLEDITHPEDLEWTQIMTYKLREGVVETFSLEIRFKHKDGTVIWGNLSMSVVTNISGGQVYYIGVLVDITERILAEEALQKAHDRLEQRVKERTAELEGTKNRLEAIFNHSSDSILLLDVNMGVQQANFTFENMFEFEYESYEGQSLADLIQPEDADTLNNTILEVASSHMAVQLETTVRRHNGTVFEVELSLAPVNRSLQPVNSLVCIIRDVTERKRTQQLIAEERNLLRTLIDAIPDFIYIKDTQHRLMLNNKAHAHFLGKSNPADLIGTTVYDYLPAERAAEIQAEEIKLYQTQQPIINLEERVFGPNGQVEWISSSKVPLRNLAGEIIGLVGIAHNISDIKFSEEALRRSEEKLRESQQMLIQVLNTIPVRVFWKDRDSIYQGCNRLFAEDAGLDNTDDITGKRDKDLPWISDNVLAYVVDDRAVMASGNAKLYYEETQRLANGTLITVQTSKLPLRDVLGNIVGVLGAYIDITARKTAEEALQRNQADLKSIIESTSLAFVLFDLEGKVRLFNQLAQQYQQKYYGFPLLVGDDTVARLPLEIKTAFRDRFDRVRLGEQVIFENMVIYSDKPVYFEFRVYPVKTDQGEIIGINLAYEDITERKEMERQLRYLASLQENMLEAVVTTDLEFNIKSWNKAAENIYGWAAAEAIGQNIRQLVPTQIVSLESGEKVSSITLEKGFWSGEATQIRRDGNQVHILASVVVLKDSRGNNVGMVAVNHDITARKQAETKLEKKRKEELEFQQYLKALHEISVELTAISKLDEFYKRVVQSGLERLGFERLAFFLYDSKTKQALGTYGTDAQGKLVSEHHLTFDPTAYTGIMKQAMHFPDRYIYAENARLYSNGDFIGMGWNAAVSLWQGSELLGWLTIDSGVNHKPVTRYNLEVLSLYRMTVAVLLANKLVEEKLHSTSQRLELATHTGGIGIWDLNLIDNTLMWDDQMLTLYGITREDFGGTNVTFQKAIHPDDFERIQAEVKAARNREKSLDLEFRIYWPNGSLHHIKSNAIILRDENDKPFREIGVNWDITNLKRSEETLRDALKKEKELGELKTRFVSRASHEFRTPLAAILATTETLSIYRAKMTETQMDIRLDKIRQQIMYLKDIMEDVLQLSRFQSGRLEFRPAQGNMDELCQSIITEFDSQTENKNRIIYNGTNSPLIATFDSRLIRQVISNLVSNALKYSSVEKPVYLDLSHNSTKITLTVRDEGIGIPPEDIKDLFEPFQRASNVGTIAGTGLGLSIALQAVEMHKGTISVESELEVGTTFTLTIPKLTVKGKEDDEDISN